MRNPPIFFRAMQVDSLMGILLAKIQIESDFYVRLSFHLIYKG